MPVLTGADPVIAASLGFWKPEYTVVERERRWLCNHVPRDQIRQTLTITDLYVDGTRLRLRDMRPNDGGPPLLRLSRKADVNRCTRLITSIYCHGILAPGASLRDRVTPGGKADESAERSRAERDFGASDRAFDAAGDREPAGRLLDDPSAFGVTSEAEQTNRAMRGSPGTNPSRVDPHDRARRLRWAPLLQRVFGIDALRCPHCGSQMRLLAAIEDPVVARKILGGLGLPARAPPLGSVAGDPKDSAYDEATTQEDRDLDQTPIEDDP